jgi:predicted DNA-binding transcriptional regulator YafY
VHTNVASLQWSSDGPVVDAGVLAVLALACRDREQVRFDYRRRDGDDSSRLVEPRQLVSTGRRWYLVAWDVRRDDWRTFRLDRLERARLAGGRCAARELPGGDAAAFVAQSIRSMPQPAYALLDVDTDIDTLRAALHWGDTQLEATASGGCRVRVEGPGDDALLRVVTWLASRYRVAVVEPESVATLVEALKGRLRVSG